MHYIIHIATAFQSFKAQPREVQELIWARTQNGWRTRDPSNPILNTTLDQYLAKQAPDMKFITALLKTKMALTPEFGHVIGIGKALAENNLAPKVKIAITRTTKEEKPLLEKFWEDLGAFAKKRGMPTFATWNGLEFTFPFLIERSTALGITPSLSLPRARFQPWKHLDLLAELGNYDHSRYISLQDRLTLWGLKLNGNGTKLIDPEAVIDQWQKGNPKPLEETLTLSLEAIHQIAKKAAPYLLETWDNN